MDEKLNFHGIKFIKKIIVAKEGTFVGVMAFNNEPFASLAKLNIIHEFSIKSHNRTSSIHPWKIHKWYFVDIQPWNLDI